MVRLTLSFLACLLTFSCNDPSLITPRKEIFTSLKINGYYIRKYEDLVSGNKFSNILFIFKNGIFLNTLSNLSQDDKEIEKWILNNYVNKQIDYQNSKLRWGSCIATNSVISLEQWYPSSGGAMPVYIRKGTILNDSTFVMLSSEKQNGKDKKIISETYHFRQFSPKPDSTNNFIK